MYTLPVSGSGSTGVTAWTEPTTAPAQPPGSASNVARGHARRSVASRGPSSLGSVTVVDCMFAPPRGTATVTSSAAPRARLVWPFFVAVSCGANGSRSQPVTWNGLDTGVSPTAPVIAIGEQSVGLLVEDGGWVVAVPRSVPLG